MTYLIQRLKSKPSPDPQRGFDGYFTLDYMGSAEFEFGAAGDALGDVRRAGVAIVEPFILESRKVYIVAAAGHSSAFDRLSEWWFGGRRSKERTYFEEHVEENTSDWAKPIDAWWVFNEPSFAFTLDESVAGLLALAFNTPKPVTDA